MPSQSEALKAAIGAIIGATSPKVQLNDELVQLRQLFNLSKASYDAAAAVEHLANQSKLRAKEFFYEIKCRFELKAMSLGICGSCCWNPVNDIDEQCAECKQATAEHKVFEEGV